MNSIEINSFCEPTSACPPCFGPLLICLQMALCTLKLHSYCQLFSVLACKVLRCDNNVPATWNIHSPNPHNHRSHWFNPIPSHRYSQLCSDSIAKGPGKSRKLTIQWLFFSSGGPGCNRWACICRYFGAHHCLRNLSGKMSRKFLIVIG